MPSKGGLLPFGMTTIPGTKAVLSTDAAVGYTIFDFSSGANATNTVFPIQGQGATCWVAHSTKTGNFYLTDLDASMVTEVNVDKNLNSTIVAVSVYNFQLCGSNVLIILRSNTHKVTVLVPLMMISPASTETSKSAN